MFKFHYRIATAAPLLLASTLTLTACATQQVWNPELEDARDTFRQISADKIVTSLAAKEISVAERQLNKAQAASDQFRPQDVVRHEANLAKLRVLIAQQRARSLSANHSLQVAMGQAPLLSEEVVLAASPPVTTPLMEEPVMAAALPDLTSDNTAVNTQLAVLTAQVAELQTLLRNQKDAVQPTAAATQVTPVRQVTPQTQVTPVTPIEVSALAKATTTSMSGEEKTLQPQIAAALPPEQQITPPSAKRLQEELNAINAKAGSRGMSLTLGERYFAQGTARLWSGRAARHLDNVAAILAENPSLNLAVEAHLDNSADSSFDLSVDRAVSIKSALVLRGIETDRIEAVGFGDSRPVADNTTPLGRLQNRRVELVFPNVPVAR